MRGLKIEVRGIVQGVGFRPFVYRVAREYGITGSVSNDSRGVTIHASGEGEQLYLFLNAIKNEAPPAAVVEEVNVFTEGRPSRYPSFEIAPSSADGGREVLVSPDIATCRECIAELFDPGDRRYLYPFINCTNCGPRFTIIAETPYDRPNTSMAKFTMCPDCAREYDDPSDRRFHAQPNACPACGPAVRLADRAGNTPGGDPVTRAAALLREGKIVAVKGLGGFQLACDATGDDAVAALRERKQRYSRPFAVMTATLEDAWRLCEIDEREADLLSGARRPIVLLREKEGSPISPQVAGGLAHQGIFLPYTPLHHLLVREAGIPLVMTSGNVSNEPIAIANDEALERLGDIADYFLLHDRDILVRYDDSVSRIFKGAEYPVRRARGYAPYPLRVRRRAGRTVLALGPELKNTFCALRGDLAFVSQHIGDMETADEVRHFEEALSAMRRLFSLSPEVVAHDLHPEYATTQMAPEFGLPVIGVQHHHAHVVSCMADRDLTGEVIGVAWDGTGYGQDGTVWGGEFLVADETGFRRGAHLYRYPMPGADACVHNLHRMAAGVMSGLFADPTDALERLRERIEIDDAEAESLLFQLRERVNTPMTSSAGRMFDAVAALAGVRDVALYDGQAACELEAIADGSGEYYDFLLDTSAEPWVVDTRPLFREVLVDLAAGTGAPEISAKFHAAMALAVVETCEALAEATGLDRVVLSGGVFQNELFGGWVVDGLASARLRPFVHRRVPCNDGGVSLGQAVVAAAKDRVS
ncbi:MAG: carbamoyltransferase HypF [Actinobacteria bacterium]|nr:carbamoyltransferase HypF [Actinomycetota bacterium]MBU2687917.1 carbamoyltransferase HypF [Actinomycetota bacterium]